MDSLSSSSSGRRHFRRSSSRSPRPRSADARPRDSEMPYPGSDVSRWTIRECNPGDLVADERTRRRSADRSTGKARADPSSSYAPRAHSGSPLTRNLMTGIVAHGADVRCGLRKKAHYAQETLRPEAPQHPQAEAVGQDARDGAPDPEGQRIRRLPARQCPAKIAGQAR